MVATLDLAAPDAAARRSLEALSLAVAKSRRIVVVTGAGISCSCGIPDFRSSDGLYNMVKKQYPNVVMKGRDLFDAALFRDPEATAVFYTFIAALKRSVDEATPSPTHDFIKALDTKKRLLRSYTQNIDGLEERAGLLGSSAPEARAAPAASGAAGKLRAKDVRNVQLHGDIHRVRCTFCSADLPCTDEHLRVFSTGAAPDCPECTQRAEVRVARSARPIKIGTLRPAIVLYDEAHPLGDDIGALQGADLARRPDLLLVMGTSLKVHGLRRLVREFARAVHDGGAPREGRAPAPWAHKVVFVNKTPPGAEWAGVIDVHVAGETDAWAARVLGDWKRARPADWEIQTPLKLAHFKVGAAGKAKVKAAGKGRKKAITAGGAENTPPGGHASGSGSATKAPTTPKRRKSGSHYAVDEGSPTKRSKIEPMFRVSPGVAEKVSKGIMDELSGSGKSLFGNKTNASPGQEQEGGPAGRGRAKGKGKAKVEVLLKKRTASSVDTPSRAKAAPPATKRKVEREPKAAAKPRAASAVGTRSSHRVRARLQAAPEVDVFS